MRVSGRLGHHHQRRPGLRLVRDRPRLAVCAKEHGDYREPRVWAAVMGARESRHAAAHSSRLWPPDEPPRSCTAPGGPVPARPPEPALPGYTPARTASGSTIIVGDIAYRQRRYRTNEAGRVTN